MRSNSLIVMLGILPLVTAGAGTPAPKASTADASKTPLTCFQPYPETEDQLVQRHFTQAVAVFSGEVRSLTRGLATIRVLQIWKGKLQSEVVIPNASRDNGDGTIRTDTEGFEFKQGETYLLFGSGSSTESMRTSVCQPNGLLKESARRVAILDKLVKGGR